MLVLKKLIFGIFFLITFALLVFKISPFLQSYNSVLSLSLNNYLQYLMLTALISLSSFFFVLFVAFSFNWKVIVPVVLLGSALAIILQDPALSLTLFVTASVSFLLNLLGLENTLKSYLTFQPTALLGPAIKGLSGLLIISFSLVFFLSANRAVAANGFQIPDSFLDPILGLLPSQPTESDTGSNLPSLNSTQIALLKQNPGLLKQYGFDPSILDNIKPSSSVTNNLAKQTAKAALNTLIKPYQAFVPAILAIIFFGSLETFSWLISLLVNPLLWLTFLILEKTGFVTFTEEQRIVRKMVI